MENTRNVELIKELTSLLEEKERLEIDNNRLNLELTDVNQKLEEAEKVKSHFISNIRNQIINPFASILGLSRNILSLDDERCNKINNMARLIFNEAFELDFQLKNIFAAAKLEAGDAFPEIAKVNISQLINSSIEEFEHRANEKQIKLIFHDKLPYNENGVFYFNTDPLKLELVLSNLICNAIAFSNAANKVEITAANENSLLVLKVEDYGIGIDQVDQKIIFDRFKKLDTAINSINKGHGLGLSVTKSLIDLLEGTIEISSQKTRGTLFIVKISEGTIQDEFMNVAVDSDEFLFDDIDGDSDDNMEVF